MQNNTFIVKASRTPVGSFGGSLAEFTSPQLGSEVIKNIINDNQIDSNKPVTISIKTHIKKSKKYISLAKKLSFLF